jgi:hypothetical protein
MAYISISWLLYLKKNQGAGSMRIIYATALALLSAGISLPAAADVLQMPGDSSPMGESRAMEIPVRGMSKDQVRAMFGQPKEALPPVGDPPITRWVYDGYTVYFEYSYVIQSVVNR